MRLGPQEEFVKLVPGAKLMRFDNARHEIYASEDETLRGYVAAVLDFLDGKYE